MEPRRGRSRRTPTAKHDGVKRSALQPIPGGLMGGLDVDIYFRGWSDDPYADW
jgi:hypothetical protein